ncbi:MAG: hypothetical protein ABR511_06900 [Acidimicrobiales bacterium]
MAGYLPLWPFASLAEARAWEAAERDGGHQPWHLDAGQTAVGFSSGYLGYAGIDAVVARTVGAVDARVTMGYHVEDGRTSAAATVHLRRFGPDRGAPDVAAGGGGTRWKVPVAVAGPAGSVVTLAVATGGPVAAVERFAVTGARVAS